MAKLMREGACVPVCPEVLGGLGVPRLPAEIRCGTGSDVLSGRASVVNSQGEDVGRGFVEGAERALAIGLQTGCTKAIVKARSPSCGAGFIYDGSFTHTGRRGDGVFVALLRSYGFEVLTDEDDWK